MTELSQGVDKTAKAFFLSIRAKLHPSLCATLSSKFATFIVSAGPHDDVTITSCIKNCHQSPLTAGIKVQGG